MQLSARRLGKEYGMTAVEMNRALVKLGILEGTPNNYYPTEKAAPYVVERSFHRGCGGYEYYNRYYDTISYDESIKEILNITEDMIKEIRSEMMAERAAKSAAKAAALATIEAERKAKEAAEAAKTQAELQASLDHQKRMDNLKTAGIATLIIAGVLAAGYGIYKATPHVKKWWKDRKDKKKEDEDAEAA